MGHSDRRVVPPALQKILKLDAEITDRFCNLANKFVPLRSLRTHYKLLEVSCHGLLWIAGWLALIWIVWTPSLFAMQVNFFIGIILDIIFVASLKAFTRRRRPAANQPDMFMTLGPDKFSFPSGHVSRACFISFFFIKLFPLHFIFLMPMLAWCTSVALSGVLLRRHHILDVLAGVILGVLEGYLISFIWLSNDAATYIVSWISDEKIEGGEYHV